MVCNSGGVDRAGDDAQVGGAVQHAAHDVAGQAFLQVDRDAGMARQEARQDVRHEFRHCRGIGENADVAGVAVGLFLEVVLQVVDLAHDDPRMLQQPLAGRGDFHAAAVAVQQAGIELVLQRLDPHADGGQRQVRPLGGLRQAGGFGDVDEQAEVGEIEVHGAYITAAGAGRTIQAPQTRP